MKFAEIKESTGGKTSPVFDSAEMVVGICAKGCAGIHTRKLDELTEYKATMRLVRRGLRVYVHVGRRSVQVIGGQILFK